MTTPPASQSYFGRIVLLNLVAVGLLFAARRGLGFPQNLLMLLLLFLAFLNGVLALACLAQKATTNLLAHLLATILIAVIGLGQCELHLGSH